MESLIQELNLQKVMMEIVNSSSYVKDSFLRFFRSKNGLLGSVLILLILLLALLGPYCTQHTYYTTHLELKNSSPSATYWLGSDDLGRDLFTRCCWGARISLIVGVCAAILDLFFGVFVGTFAALSGGKVDEIIMRFCDILQGIPYLILVILLMVVMGPGLVTIIVALSMTGWINMARIVRGEMLQLKKSDFVLAAKSLGTSAPRIVLRHLLPNAIGPIVATMTMTIPAAIFAEAFLSFLGLGVQAPVASWGVMVNEALGALRYYPWRLFFPAGMITITMLGFNLIGDTLRDAFDPKLKHL
jgi:oligopeptide transport system permease protein